MSDLYYDVAVIGGGVNGAGIARDAAGRGLNTLLLEAKDLAQATSSASSKIVHGGLRYLEQYEFLLVRKALRERENLLRIAPHILRPMEFILPHNNELRPKWMIRAGLFLYDHLARRRTLPDSRHVHLNNGGTYGGPLNPDITEGYSYADCWVEDSRLVVLNALDAAERGAHVRTREGCENVHLNKDGFWEIESSRGRYKARALINATGPWVDRFFDSAGLRDYAPRNLTIRLVKGSHIIVPRLYTGRHSYILQISDGRIVFVMPFEDRFSLIGTTDVEIEAGEDEDIYAARATNEEVNYLCEAVTANFRKALLPEDVLWTYSGVRPLIDDGKGNASEITRDYKIIRCMTGSAPLYAVYGGKITTYRLLAQQTVDRLMKEDVFSQGQGRLSNKDAPARNGTIISAREDSRSKLISGWTAKYPLPGGDIAEYFPENRVVQAAAGPQKTAGAASRICSWLPSRRHSKETQWRRSGGNLYYFTDALAMRYSWLDRGVIERWAKAYGTRAESIVKGARNESELGVHFGEGVYQAEIDYLLRTEWAQTEEDILFRRSRLGLYISPATRQAITEYIG